jgi:hypothetical protein
MATAALAQPHVEARVPTESATTAPRLFVLDYGYHTAIVVEQPAGGRFGPPGREDAVASPFVEYAWGDRRFYMESRYAPWSLVATLLFPTEAVTYVAGWRTPPVSRPGGLTVVSRPGGLTVVSRTSTLDERDRLLAALESWVGRDSAGRARAPAFPAVAGYAGRFHAAPGRYTAIANCNRWTVDRLAEVGLARPSGVVITSGQVMRRVVGFEGITAPPRRSGSGTTAPAAAERIGTPRS